MENSIKDKGNSILIFVSQISNTLFSCGCSSSRTAFLKFRRVERHPYRQDCMHKKLHAHAIFVQIACACNWACNFWGHAIGHAIFEGMQSCQYGRLSTRLDSRNAVLGDERPQLTKSRLVFEIKIRMEIPLYFFEFSIINWKMLAFHGKLSKIQNSFFLESILLSPDKICFAFFNFNIFNFLEHPNV